jgi:hypothetical protein
MHRSAAMTGAHIFGPPGTSPVAPERRSPRGGGYHHNVLFYNDKFTATIHGHGNMESPQTTIRITSIAHLRDDAAE